MNAATAITKRIDTLTAKAEATREAAANDRASLASELTSGALVDSVRLMGWVQRLARHEAELAAIELAIRELSTVACVLD